MLYLASMHLYFSWKRRIKTVARVFFRLLTMQNKHVKWMRVIFPKAVHKYSLLWLQEGFKVVRKEGVLGCSSSSCLIIPKVVLIPKEINLHIQISIVMLLLLLTFRNYNKESSLFFKGLCTLQLLYPSLFIASPSAVSVTDLPNSCTRHCFLASEALCFPPAFHLRTWGSCSPRTDSLLRQPPLLLLHLKLSSSTHLSCAGLCKVSEAQCHPSCSSFSIMKASQERGLTYHNARAEVTLQCPVASF